MQEYFEKSHARSTVTADKQNAANAVDVRKIVKNSMQRAGDTFIQTLYKDRESEDDCFNDKHDNFESTSPYEKFYEECY